LTGARLAAAERDYRVALERDAMFVEARLRLGRVLARQGKDDEADAALTAAAAGDTARVRYLAHLFRGELADHRGDLAAARREYEAAMKEAPECQTPYLALGHLEDAAGNAARARQLVGQLAQLGPTSTDDPWWSYQNGGINRDALQWLIDYVRR
jgi:Tfp pilus assembly protein PilF